MIFALANIFYVLVVALHVYFVILEMVLWKKRAPVLFGVSQEYADTTAKLASNQGLYNGFIVAALMIGFLARDPVLAHDFQLYGLVCVVAAGLWGGATVNKRIFLVQAVPGLIALFLTFPKFML